MTTPKADPAPPRASGASVLAYWRDVLLIATLAISGLYAGSGFLIPLVLAILTFVLISAIARRFAGLRILDWRMPNWLAQLLGVVTVVAGLFAITYIMGTQANNFAGAVPRYEAQFDAALGRISYLVGTDIGVFVRDHLVRIDMSLIAMSAFGGARSVVTYFVLIGIYVGFMMAERHLTALKIQLVEEEISSKGGFGRVMHQIAFSLQRYILVKTFFSVLTALFSYAVFLWLGLEFAETWAVLTFALNYIPSVGSILSVILPSLVALVQFETFGPFLTIALGCGAIQFIIGNLLDPAVTGRSLNLSALMVILALTFWSAIWGIMGAFLSVPLTVCLLIVFSHLPATRPLAILMSKDGQLFYDEPGT
ncbi:MAG: AI-2E family transporter [Sedimentitalea sp.]|nr:AI-2E family transporter [Sedimentitalea sp.]